MLNNLNVNDVIEGEVSDFASDGEGVVKLDSFAVFIPFAIVGERVRARVSLVKKDFAFADLIEVLTPSIERVKPVCPYYTRCGGCNMQHISRDLQLEIKRKNLERLLLKNGGITASVPQPVRLNDWAYRNKLSLPFGFNKKSGRVYLGFYERRSHKAVPMKWCPLHGDWAAELIQTVVDWAVENKVSVYDEQTGQGLLRHLVARRLDALCVTFTVNGDALLADKEIVDRLTRKFPGCAVYVSPNKGKNNLVLGRTAKLIGGSPTPQKIGNAQAIVSPLSFFQVNDEIRDALYNEVCAVLSGFDGEIIELYSGVGLLTAEIARRLPNVKITGVEIVPQAVENAAELIRASGLEARVAAVCADAETYLDTASLSSGKRILLLDPPRKGCSRELLEAASRADFEKIVYISCNPATLARDIKILKETYSPVFFKPFDMFPQTSGLETLAVLNRNKN